jgi:hypothetical protein
MNEDSSNHQRAKIGTLPLVLGVSGHSDLQLLEKSELEKSVRKIFTELQGEKKYNHTPLALISALAAGADQLVAEIALEFDAKLIVPLPMPLSLYTDDFKDEALENFQTLLKKAWRVFEVPLVPGNTIESISEKGRPRDLQYALSGVYVARNCQILISLWDLEDSGKTGGTSQIVSFKLTGEFPDEDVGRQLESVPEPYSLRISALNPPGVGPVYCVITPRSKERMEEVDAYQLTRMYPSTFDSDQAAMKYYSRIFGLVEEYNRDALQIPLKTHLSTIEKNSTNFLIREDDASVLSDSSTRMRQHFAQADALAQLFQIKTHRAMITLCILAYIAAFFLGAAHVLTHFQTPWILAYYQIFLIIGAATFLWAKMKHYQEKYQDYRAIAEGLRVQFFWIVAGLKNSVADLYLRKQLSELDWIRNAIRAWNILEEPEPEGKKSVLQKSWIEDQDNYFRQAEWQNRKKLILYKYWMGQLLLTFSLLTPVMPIFLDYRLTHSFAIWFAFVFLVLVAAQAAEIIQGSVDELKDLAREARAQPTLMRQTITLLPRAILHGFLCILLIGSIVAVIWIASSVSGKSLVPFPSRTEAILLVGGLMAVLGGLHQFYVERMALPEQVKHFKRMTLIFQNARRHFDDLTDSDFVDLGRESLAENGEWVLLHRERPVEMPRAAG